MRRIVFLLLTVLLVLPVVAQPEARRRQQEAAKAKSNKDNLTLRQQISFPTEQSMSEDVVWRRDVYREIDLTQDANAGLYYPTEPLGSQMNLFTYLFKLVMIGPNHGGVAAYKYTLDGNENFTEANRVKPLEFLKDNDIYYERTDRGVHIDDADIPSKEVKAYYVKETSYYDQSTATFHTKVLALCPVMLREDDFGDGATRYPLFWVRYDDLAPMLAKQTIMTSNLNNAATMSLDDYFTMNRYQGKIYKTNNMLGQTLAQYCKTDSALNKEQQRIEHEIETFEQNIWGDKARKDSLDSISKLDRKSLKALKRNRRSSNSSVRRRRSSSSQQSGQSARVTVRRQRH
ncbi:MAG: gliding motility protein GldN [Prevotella sp.]|jgi:gliding motility associated protien GldN